ncbi:MAG: hypothetical protein WB440_00150 [Steroidobacteraceae bacterium]|jgi:PBP1b-binding outer membrane lipoprotein LpoB
MRPSAILAAVLLISGCSSSRSGQEAYQSARALYLRDKDLPGFAGYVNTSLGSRTLRSLNRAKCRALDGPQRILLILMVDRSGRITEVDSDSSSAKANCLRDSLQGAGLPIPPFAPLPVTLGVE